MKDDVEIILTKGKEDTSEPLSMAKVLKGLTFHKGPSIHNGSKVCNSFQSATLLEL